MASRRNPERVELDMVPIMNLVTILIPFLLMSAHFVTLSTVNVTQPAIGEERPVDDPAPGLSLKILITEDGYTVSTAGQEIGPEDAETVELGKDLAALTELLAHIKGDWPDEDMVILVPDASVPYDKIIATMDAARASEGQDLFPNVIIAGGTN